MLNGKTIVLGITGGIAAYKSAYLASLLIKDGAHVQVIMTEHAKQFITPTTLEGLTNERCLADTFDRNHEFSTEHIAIAKRADAVIIAPATANTIAKLSHGLADDMLTTTVLACTCPKIVAPAMNSNMYENQITQKNIKTLKDYGIQVVEPEVGRLACGDAGSGKMAEPEVLLQYVRKACAYSQDLKEKKVLVTAGPTKERIDPVRFITNPSTGKMGYSIAQICALRGAEVTLVTGETEIVPPLFVEVVSVITAEQMFEQVVKRSGRMDIIIKAAAVADYKPKVVSEQKVKKTEGDITIEMERTQDILAYLGTHRKKGQFLCGFSMETENMLENSKKKLEKKQVDMIVANNLKEEGAGFGVDTNVITLIKKQEIKEFPLLTKEEAAQKIIDEIIFCVES